MAKLTNTRRGFYGDPKDREEFLALANSDIRSPERAAALATWSDYKKARGLAYVMGQKRGRGKLHEEATKLDYIESLTAPAIHLQGLRLRDVILGYADLRGVRLDDAKFNLSERGWNAFKGASFERASLRRARLKDARLMNADFTAADLRGANLENADLSGATFSGADLTGASAKNANLERASLMRANLSGCDLRGARVYGAALWDVIVCENETLRTGLIVTPDDEPELLVDNLDVAQFAYTLLSGSRIGHAFDTLAKAGVLLLGNFSKERKALLEALRTALRSRGYVPIIFDFQRPKSLDLTETVHLLVGMSSFVIVDLTNPRSSPLEVQATIPVHMTPFVPLIQRGEQPFAMFQDLLSKHGDWVLDPLEYRDQQELLDALDDGILKPAETKRAELLELKTRKPKVRRAKQYRSRTSGPASS